MACWLHSVGADINGSDAEGQTPLIAALENIDEGDTELRMPRYPRSH
jgi:hypothetical protein